MDAIRLKDKLNLFEERWTQKIVASLDDNHVYVAKLEGDFIWHSHDKQDEMFLVLDGRLKIEFRDKEVWLEEGDMIVVPKGMEHRPQAPEPCSVLIIEKADTEHTGGIDDPLRKENHERI